MTLAPPPLDIGEWDDTHEITPVVRDASPVATDAGTGQAVRYQGGQVARHVQASEAVHHAFRVARHRVREIRDREGGLPHAAYTGTPPSLKEHRDYGYSKVWVPPGHEHGGVADRYGTFYNKTIGTAGVALCDAGAWIFHKAFRFTVAFLAAYVLTAITLAIFGLKSLAFWLIIGLAAFALLLVGLLRFWPQRKDQPIVLNPDEDQEGSAS